MADCPTASSTLAEADGWWLCFRCPACQHGVWWPCRWMARNLGGHWPVHEIVPRLVCKRCRVRPDVVELVEHPWEGAPGTGSTRTPRTVRLLGAADMPSPLVIP